MCKKVLKYREDQTTIKDVQNAVKEFEVLYRISHPCICKSIGIKIQENVGLDKEEGEEITTVAIFLEYVDYKLTDFLKSKMFNNSSKILIVLDVVHALNYIHKHRIIYRDLKNENIMLNSLYETKLVDFGLVKISESVIDGFSYITNSLSHGVGTFAYMSPEMANDKDYTNKTDVYSFGVILFVLFTENLPKQRQKEKLSGKQIKLPHPSNSISLFCIKLIENANQTILKNVLLLKRYL